MNLLEQRKKIPDNWVQCELGEALTLQRGFDLPHRLRNEGEIPIISSSGVSGRHDKSMASPPGIVTGRYGTIGEIFYVNEPYWPLNTTLYVRDFRGMTAKYAYYFLKTIDFESHSGKSGVPGINRNDIHKEIISFPVSAIEQNAIANVLSDTDVLITELEQLVAKKQAIKTASMQQLMTGRIRLSGFNGTWRCSELKHLVSTPITDGPHMTPKFYDTGVPFLSVNNLVNNRIDLADLRYISKKDDELFSKKCKPKKGDVLIGKAASVGKVAFVEEAFDFNIWSPIALIRTNNSIDPKFLYYQLMSAYSVAQIMLFTNSSSQGNIGMGDIEKIEIRFPDNLNEQTRIATILSDMDAELATLERKLAKVRDLKQGMMQQLLTGRIRLPLEQQL